MIPKIVDCEMGMNNQPLKPQKKMKEKPKPKMKDIFIMSKKKNNK
jgi:hypothetical protein